ncbi:hypothetical protein BOTBODRAFT_170400 [Botryobasidium botryosum FD-172 SS1]|uniref:Uncharacterized protein n=1 Tax=Botryobasidium botryosum (strain FD-172 SS1) TaxID=930990 RepID=A0A067MU74_BOTB1|nr:hypothetical protein BOTBODRAFT_170400 [Botryobasidium botryosum FD-172 SS1]
MDAPFPVMKYTPSRPVDAHPYAIKTTSTGLLTRSNSRGSAAQYAHSFSPIDSPSPKPRSDTTLVRGHRHTKSLTSLTNPPPLPLPAPTSPVQSTRPLGDSVTDTEDAPHTPQRLKRSGTLPVYPTPEKIDREAMSESLRASDIAGLPQNPKLWTPTHLSVYLSSALRLKGGGSVPNRVAQDIAGFVVQQKLTGKSFLRLTDEDLDSTGVNQLWKDALLYSSRALRKNILKGRIWGFGSPPDLSHSPSNRRVPSTVYEQPQGEEESRQGRGSRLASNSFPRKEGKVRGLVASIERTASSGSEVEEPSFPPLTWTTAPEDDAGWASGELSDDGDADVDIDALLPDGPLPGETEDSPFGESSISSIESFAPRTPPRPASAVGWSPGIGDALKAPLPEFEFATTERIEEHSIGADETILAAHLDMPKAQGDLPLAQPPTSTEELEPTSSHDNEYALKNSSHAPPAAADDEELPMSELLNLAGAGAEAWEHEPEMNPKDTARKIVKSLEAIQSGSTRKNAGFALKRNVTQSSEMLWSLRQRLEEMERKVADLEAARERDREEREREKEEKARVEKKDAGTESMGAGLATATSPDLLDDTPSEGTDTQPGLPTYVLTVSLGLCIVIAKAIYKRL